ncbi:hypothetical protein NUW58_g3512 [Xylaria curta]|uniref:Uncharacterized protein n=1 Tax=Xylaria curta TaxID=42375 RepID=A0ACC1PAL2_9PEZI|nr:hypothetical protein NUW58_g3512 [Xylaria curta]
MHHSPSVFLDRTLPREIRFLAIIQLKNGLDVCWRAHTVKNALQPPEKQRIRSNLFRGSIEEPDPQLALHNALAIAKIVRADYPSEWPDAIDSLVAQLRARRDDDQSLAGALLILLRIVKELGTARLLRSQKALQAATPELVGVLGEIYNAKTTLWSSFMASGQGDERNAVAAMANSLIAFKILRRLLIAGYEVPHRDEVARQIWAYSQSQLGQLLPIVDDKYPALGKHLLQFTKLHIDMADSHPASFAALPGSAELCPALIGTSSPGFPRGLANQQEFAKAAPRVIKYRSKEVAQEQQEALSAIKSQLFSDEFVKHVAQIIITHLLIFRKADMDAWEGKKPRKGNGEQPRKRAKEMPTSGKPIAWPILRQLKTPQASIVVKEAVYTVMGLSAPIVVSTFDFDNLLKTIIANDAVQAIPMCQILRRRIAILLSQLISVQTSDDVRPLIYQVFRHFLNPDDPHNDIVVRITAARQFQRVVDEFGFNETVFLPHAPYVLRELVRLVLAVELDETRLAIAETMRTLISRMGVTVTQSSDLIMEALPDIWKSAGDSGYMMKQAVLATLVSLVVAMRTESHRYYHLILPLIAEATHEGAEAYTYLIEEALELWVHVLRQSQSPLSPDLLNLASAAVKQLADQTEHAHVFIAIVDSYVTLAPQTLLEDHYRQPLLKSLLASLETKSRDQLVLTTALIGRLFRSSHQLGGDPGFQLLMRDAMDVGFLRYIFEGIRNAYEAHQTTGPKKTQSRLPSYSLACYFCILSHIAVIDPSTFVALLEILGPVDVVWNWLSAEWFSIFDTTGDIDRLKLNLLGLTRLLELPHPMAGLVLGKLQDYLVMWTSVILSLWDQDAPGYDALCSQEGNEDTVSSEWDTPKDAVERELYKADPIRSVASYAFVKERLEGLARTVGEQTFQEWLGNVDKEILTGFQNIENGPSTP